MDWVTESILNVSNHYEFDMLPSDRITMALQAVRECNDELIGESVASNENFRVIISAIYHLGDFRGSVIDLIWDIVDRFIR